MKARNATALILIIVGGLTWGLVEFFDFNLVAALFRADSWPANIVYILVGIAALYSFYLLKPATEAARGTQSLAKQAMGGALPGPLAASGRRSAAKPADIRRHMPHMTE